MGHNGTSIEMQQYVHQIQNIDIYHTWLVGNLLTDSAEGQLEYWGILSSS